MLECLKLEKEKRKSIFFKHGLMKTWKEFEFSKYEEEKEEANIYFMTNEYSLDESDEEVDFIDFHPTVEVYMCVIKFIQIVRRVYVNQETK